MDSRLLTTTELAEMCLMLGYARPDGEGGCPTPLPCRGCEPVVYPPAERFYMQLWIVALGLFVFGYVTAHFQRCIQKTWCPTPRDPDPHPHYQ